jgi:LuxR family maltose regulon positive regulatory protein
MAAQHLLRSTDLGEGAALPEHRYRWYVAMAGIREARGDLDVAGALLDEAERFYRPGFFPTVRPIGALRANLWIAQASLQNAMSWVRAHGLSVDDEVGYTHEFEHLTLARVLLARYRGEQDPALVQGALGLLHRLLEAAEQADRMGSVIEILTLEAVAHEATGDLPGALAPLGRALTLAEPEGYVRTFVAGGAPMRDLLGHAVAAGIRTAYALNLLAAFEEQAEPAAVARDGERAGLPSLLTARELEILRLVAVGMTNQGIADHLVISLPTVKRHIANAYGKLEVGNRTEAVARANELSLL